MHWIFEGLKELIGFVIGACGGGFIGYRIGINRISTKQIQKAGNDASQIQVTRGSKIAGK